MKTKNIKVQYSSRYQANSLLPKIQMEGKWLEALGFSVGTKLVVEYEEGSIRIRPFTEAETNAAREQELHVAIAQKQRELDELKTILPQTAPLSAAAEDTVSYGKAHEF